MKKSFLAVLAICVLSTPLVVLGIISVMRVKPEVAQRPIADFPMAEAKPAPVVPEEVRPVAPAAGQPTAPPIPTTSFMNGYWDGWHGKWLGPIRWTLSDDYRQGHMLGSYDRKNGIHRYPAPK